MGMYGGGMYGGGGMFGGGYGGGVDDGVSITNVHKPICLRDTMCSLQPLTGSTNCGDECDADATTIRGCT